MHDRHRIKPFCPGDLVYVRDPGRGVEASGVVLDYLEQNVYDPAFVLCLVEGVTDWYPSKSVHKGF
jgi:hypothetical protein